MSGDELVWLQKYKPLDDDYRRSRLINVQNIAENHHQVMMKVLVGEEYQTYLKIKEKLDEAVEENITHLVPILDVGEFDFLRDYVIVPKPNYSLVDYFTKEPQNFAIDLQVCLQIANGIGQLHDLDIVHCDLRPENIFFFEELQIFKIGNFSNSILLGLEKKGNSATRKMDYMYQAPEVVKCLDFSKSSDIFSLGVIMYQLLSRESIIFNKISIGKSIYFRKNEVLENINNSKLEKTLIELLLMIFSESVDKRPNISKIKEKIQNMQEKVCKTCGKVFIPAFSVGDLDCFYHPGYLYDENLSIVPKSKAISHLSGNLKYICCGSSPYSVGCSNCAHNHIDDMSQVGLEKHKNIFDNVMKLMQEYQKTFQNIIRKKDERIQDIIMERNAANVNLKTLQTSIELLKSGEVINSQAEQVIETCRRIIFNIDTRCIDFVLQTGLPDSCEKYIYILPNIIFTCLFENPNIGKEELFNMSWEKLLNSTVDYELKNLLRTGEPIFSNIVSMIYELKLTTNTLLFPKLSLLWIGCNGEVFSSTVFRILDFVDRTIENSTTEELVSVLPALVLGDNKTVELKGTAIKRFI